jgi:hypothetical protein
MLGLIGGNTECLFWGREGHRIQTSLFLLIGCNGDRRETGGGNPLE